MTVCAFLSDRSRQIAARMFFTAAACLFLCLTGTQTGIVVLLGSIWGLVFLGGQVIDYLRIRSRLQELESIMDGLDKKYLFAECVPGGRDAYERCLLELSHRAGRAMIAAVSDAEAARKAYREYVESWVHEMKTPITAAGLICRNIDAGNRRKLSGELAQIEAHVERALFYARAESPEKDFMICQVNLEELAAQAIGQYRALLIQSGIRVETRDLEQTVYTDSKWTVFILGQLLQNAARYRSEEPVVTVWAGKLGTQVQLAVQDNGIGIAEHELPRVFERGYTGSNGRIRGGSTGMGLYLCRKLTERLGMDLRIASESGCGTTVTITFPAKGNLT